MLIPPSGRDTKVTSPLQCPSPSHPNPPPSSPSTTPSSFPRVRSLPCSVSLSDISHSFFSLFPFIPFHYFLYSSNEWDHIMFVLLWLTYFTQHNTFQFHPRWSKWLSNIPLYTSSLLFLDTKNPICGCISLQPIALATRKIRAKFVAQFSQL